jgi:hypothetical protein
VCCTFVLIEDYDSVRVIGIHDCAVKLDILNPMVMLIVIGETDNNGLIDKSFRIHFL